MEYNLIQTIAACLVSALIFGLIASKLKLPAIFGYLVAGIAIGPYTPGFFADVTIAKQLAEIGIILLMFGIGLHFSFKDLVRVRNVAVPGALTQMMITTSVGATAVHFVGGFPWATSFLYGFSLSAASTVVLLRALERRRLVSSNAGKVAVGWLIVEDTAMIFAIVLLPVVSDMLFADKGLDLKVIILNVLETILQLGVFAAIMIFTGRRILPPVLVYVARTKSQELSSLTVLAIAIGCSYVAYQVFDASFALGAFIAGLVINESDIGNKAADQSIPLRDVFAVLFFVSVGMLFNPLTLVEQPWQVLMTLAIIMGCKAIGAFFIIKLLGQDREVGSIMAVSIAQIGEFSFIFAGLAATEGLLPDGLLNLVLAGALLSIALNHFLFEGLDRLVLKREK